MAFPRLLEARAPRLSGLHPRQIRKVSRTFSGWFHGSSTPAITQNFLCSWNKKEFVGLKYGAPRENKKRRNGSSEISAPLYFPTLSHVSNYTASETRACFFTPRYSLSVLEESSLHGWL
jgi:hypothetical protein